MSRLKIYGIPMSRAFRVLWMANELELDYENVPIHFADSSSKTPEYLAINPNGKIPAIEDGGLKLWESMAINLYLAKKHDKGLWLNSPETEAQATQWSVWVMAECPDAHDRDRGHNTNEADATQATGDFRQFGRRKRRNESLETTSECAKDRCWRAFLPFLAIRY